jgi:hypothetical protein
LSIDVDASGGKSIRPTTVYRDTLRTYARRAPQLLLIGAIVFVPLGLLEAVVGRLGPIGSAADSGITIVAVLALLLVQVVVGLVGEVFYSGAIANLIAFTRQGARLSLRTLAVRLAYGRLIAVAVLYDLAVAVGLLAFVVPGVVLFALLALAAPLVELQGCSVREAFARSRELVRGCFWRVLVVLGPITLASQSLDDAVRALGHHLVGHGLMADWLADAATSILVYPLYAVAAVLITIQLLGRPPDGPCETRAPR